MYIASDPRLVKKISKVGSRRILLYETTVGQTYESKYGVATISRLLKMIGLFCKRAL